MAAHAALAASHADAGERLEAIELMRVALTRSRPQRGRRHALATADNLVVGNRVDQMSGIRIRGLERRAKARLARELAVERRDARRIGGSPDVLQQRERDAFALQRGDVGAANAGAVARQIDPRYARATRSVALRNPNDAPIASQSTRCSAPAASRHARPVTRRAPSARIARTPKRMVK